MNSKFLLLLGRALTLGPAAASAGEPLRLAPSSDWRFYRDEDRCRLARTFGSEDDRTTLVFEQSGPEARFNVSAVGRSLRNVFGPRIEIALAPSDEPFARGYIMGKQATSGLPYVFLHGVNAEDPGCSIPFAEASELTLSRALPTPVTLDTGPLREPLDRLQTCAAELAETLGHSALSRAQFVEPPRPASDPGEWLNSQDYPRTALRERREDVIRFRLTVNSKGKASSCFITESGQPGEFEDAVCLALLRRATFEPALDAAGRPVAAYWSSAVRFEIN